MAAQSPIIHQLIQGWQQPGWLNRALLPLSILYGVVTAVRRWAYSRSLLPASRVPVPVIVVGNLSVGGTGKSPLVLALATELKAAGWYPGIISRGYGGTVGEQPHLVGDADLAEQVGDEPLMLHRTGIAPVVVGRNRFASVNLLVHRRTCDIVISDDGFQHLQLRRDIDVIVIDGERGFGNGWCLPSGPLREPRSALGAGSAVVVNGPLSATLQQQLAEYPVPFFSMQVRPASPYRLGSPRQRRLLESFSGEQVLAVAGLGNPERFFAALERAGMVVSRRVFPDHYCYQAADFADVNDGQLIVMTEKDAVKCGALLAGGEIDSELASRIWVLPVTAEPDARFFDLIHATLPALADVSSAHRN